MEDPSPEQRIERYAATLAEIERQIERLEDRRGTVAGIKARLEAERFVDRLHVAAFGADAH